MWYEKYIKNNLILKQLYTRITLLMSYSNIYAYLIYISCIVVNIQICLYVMWTIIVPRIAGFDLVKAIAIDIFSSEVTPLPNLQASIHLLMGFFITILLPYYIYKARSQHIYYVSQSAGTYVEMINGRYIFYVLFFIASIVSIYNPNIYLICMLCVFTNDILYRIIFDYIATKKYTQGDVVKLIYNNSMLKVFVYVNNRDKLLKVIDLY